MTQKLFSSFPLINPLSSVRNDNFSFDFDNSFTKISSAFLSALVTKFLGKKIPAGGGFYLRTLPLRVIQNAIKKYEKEEIPGVFYIHSWELTPEFMPRVKMSKKDEFVTYHNIKKAYQKMEKLLEDFQFTSFENFMKNPK